MSEIIELDQRRRTKHESAHAAQASARAAAWTPDDELVHLKLSFRQLVLIHRALETLKTSGFYTPQDELLGDTTQLVDLALDKAV